MGKSERFYAAALIKKLLGIDLKIFICYSVGDAERVLFDLSCGLMNFVFK